MKRNILRPGGCSTEKIKYMLEQKESGKLFMKDFCKIHGITAATYYNWRAPVKVV